jgi:hypothetical protein
MFFLAPPKYQFCLYDFWKTFSKIHIFPDSIFRNRLKCCFYIYFFPFIFQKNSDSIFQKFDYFGKCFPKSQIFRNAESEICLEKIFRNSVICDQDPKFIVLT